MQCCSISPTIDKILASFSDRVTQRGILSVAPSDQQRIYYKRKITRLKRGGHKKIKFRSYDNYTVDRNKKALGESNFSSCENFDNVNGTNSKFTQSH